MLSSGDPLRRDPSASAENWQEAPVNRWSFWNVRELLPTHPVARGDGPVRPLPDHPRDQDVLAVEVTRIDGTRATVGDVLADTWTDAYAVLQAVASSRRTTSRPGARSEPRPVLGHQVDGGLRGGDPGRPRAAGPCERGDRARAGARQEITG